MTRILFLFMVFAAAPASAGSYSGAGVAGRGMVCTDHATATFDVTFAGRTCTVDGHPGVAGRDRGALTCAFAEGGDRHLLRIGVYRTFTLFQEGPPTVMDGQCFGG